jgi:hypothetical protein
LAKKLLVGVILYELATNVPKKDQNCNDKRLRIAMVEILKNSLAIDRTYIQHTAF